MFKPGTRQGGEVKMGDVLAIMSLYIPFGIQGLLGYSHMCRCFSDRNSTGEGTMLYKGADLYLRTMSLSTLQPCSTSVYQGNLFNFFKFCNDVSMNFGQIWSVIYNLHVCIRLAGLWMDACPPDPPPHTMFAWRQHRAL